MSDVRVRIAPSPTGPLHIGTARTALFNYLFARNQGAVFILRLEDTDAVRSSFAFEKDIVDGLHWLGLTWDEGPDVAGGPDHGPYGPYRQMKRLPLYEEAAARLRAADQAYPCYCTPEELDAVRRRQEAAHEPPRYNRRCALLTPAQRAAFEAEGRRPALRFRVAEGVISFDDMIRGRVEIDTANIGGDFIIVRADGTPLYHFTVVVDDAAMKISHVIRGEDHLSNTPKHILLFRALGESEPHFGHLPLILNPDRTKMSKRKSQTAIADYIEQGFVREALVNYLALLGWSTGTEEEALSLPELVERFDIRHAQQAGAAFDRERLECRRLVHGYPRRGARSSRGPAVVRHPGRARLRANPRPAGPGPRSLESGGSEMTRDDIQAWLDRYLDAWRTYDPQKIADLFSEDAEYRYHPWDEPERGRETIVRGWLEPAGNASDRDAPGSYDAHYEPYAVEGDRAVAVGRSRYTRPDGSFRALYHNVFLLRFDLEGRCRSFTEFFVEQPKRKDEPS